MVTNSKKKENRIPRAILMNIFRQIINTLMSNIYLIWSGSHTNLNYFFSDAGWTISMSTTTNIRYMPRGITDILIPSCSWFPYPFFFVSVSVGATITFFLSVSVGETMVQACNINFMWSELLLMHVSSPRRRSISTRQLILHACIRLWGCLTHWALVSSNPMKRESKNTTPPPCSPSCSIVFSHEHNTENSRNLLIWY